MISVYSFIELLIFSNNVIKLTKKSVLTYFIVYDPETIITKRAGPHCVSLYQLRKLASKYKRDLANENCQNCRKVSFVIDGTDCNKKM